MARVGTAVIDGKEWTVCYPSRKVLVGLAQLGLVILLGSCAAMTLSAGRVPLELMVCAVIGAVMSLGCLLRVVRLRFSIALNDEGILFGPGAGGEGYYRWDDFDRVGVFRWGVGEFIGFRPKDIDGFLERKSSFARVGAEKVLKEHGYLMVVLALSIPMPAHAFVEMLHTRYGVQTESS